MAKLQIKHKEGKEGFSFFNRLEILIDGRKINAIKSLKLDLDYNHFTEAHITFAVEDLEIDAEVVAVLKAQIKEEMLKNELKDSMGL